MDVGTMSLATCSDSSGQARREAWLHTPARLILDRPTNHVRQSILISPSEYDAATQAQRLLAPRRIRKVARQGREHRSTLTGPWP
jgi:hypothetical protein